MKTDSPSAPELVATESRDIVVLGKTFNVSNPGNRTDEELANAALCLMAVEALSDEGSN